AADVSEWRRSQHALRTIADTSRALAGALDVEGVTASVARSIEGGVIVGLLEDDDHVVVRAGATADERLDGQLRALVGRVTPLVPGSVGDEVIRARVPVLL